MSARALPAQCHWYLGGCGCPTAVSCENCHKITVLSKGVIVFQYCDFHLQSDTKQR